jgi:DNA replication protein DnaC
MAEVTTAQLLAVGIYEDYHGKGLKQYVGSKRVRRDVTYFASTLTTKGTGLSLLLTGPHNSGKTLLAMHIAQVALAVHHLSVRVVDIEQLTNAYTVHWSRERSADEASELETIKTPDLLVIDEIARTYTNDAVRAALFSVMDYRVKRKLPTVITTKLSFDLADHSIAQVFGDDVVALLERRYLVVHCPASGKWQQQNEQEKIGDLHE